MHEFQTQVTQPHPVAMKTTNQDWHDKTCSAVEILISTPASIPVCFMVSSPKYLLGCLYFQTNPRISSNSLQGHLGCHVELFRQA